MTANQTALLTRIRAAGPTGLALHDVRPDGSFTAVKDIDSRTLDALVRKGLATKAYNGTEWRVMA